MKPVVVLFSALLVGAAACAPPAAVIAGAHPEPRSFDLVELLEAGRLRATNRAVTAFEEQGRRGVRVDEQEVPGVVWIEGVELLEGVLEVEVRGRDAPQRSFVGVAFHGANDSTYEAVYVRPFNFRSANPEARERAIQYISHPAHTWRRLRDEHPGVYEAPLNPPPAPDAWVHLRLEVRGGIVRVYVDRSAVPALTVDQLAAPRGSRVGLWVGNPSDGEYRGLRLSPG